MPCAQPESVRKADKQLPRALDAYRRVLERSEANAFAANGVGAVLAEQGHLGAARAVFAQARRPRLYPVEGPDPGYDSKPGSWRPFREGGWLAAAVALIGLLSGCQLPGCMAPFVQIITEPCRVVWLQTEASQSEGPAGTHAWNRVWNRVCF